VFTSAKSARKMMPAWKNSPVKASFEERQNVQSPSDGAAGSELQLRSDNEIYSILLSEASSAMFDDDDDHRSSTRREKKSNLIDRMSSVSEKTKQSQALPNVELERAVSRTTLNDSKELKTHYSTDTETDAAPAMLSPPGSVTKRSSEGKESEYLHVDYELLKFVDYLADVERRFPSTTLMEAAPVMTMNDLSVDVLAEQVLRKVNVSRYDFCFALILDACVS
jgi:hypothetical protein